MGGTMRQQAQLAKRAVPPAIKAEQIVRQVCNVRSWVDQAKGDTSHEKD